MNYYSILKELASYLLQTLILYFAIVYLSSRPLPNKDRLTISIVAVLVIGLFEKLMNAAVPDNFSDCQCNGNTNDLGGYRPVNALNEEDSLISQVPMNNNDSSRPRTRGSGLSGPSGPSGPFGGSSPSGPSRPMNGSSKINPRDSAGAGSGSGSGSVLDPNRSMNENNSSEYAGQDPDGYNQALLCKNINTKNGSLTLPIRPLTINGKTCSSVVCSNDICSVSCNDDDNRGLLTKQECRDLCYKGIFND